MKKRKNLLMSTNAAKIAKKFTKKKEKHLLLAHLRILWKFNMFALFFPRSEFAIYLAFFL